MLTGILERMYSRYGLPVVAGILILIITGWGVSHWLAAPGGDVSVGPYKYTKDGGPGRGSVRCPERPFVPVRQIAVTPTTAAARVALGEFRRKQGLRALGYLESGKNIAQMPHETFGFVADLYFDEQQGQLRARGMVSGVAHSPATQFEVHRSRDGALSVVGFSSPQDAAQAQEQEPSDATRQIVLFPAQQRDATVLLEVPEGALVQILTRTLQMSQKSSSAAIDATLRASNAAE
jgi:hypothetical protein